LPVATIIRRRRPIRPRNPISLDITPHVAAGRQLIGGYGDGGFRISGERYEGSLIVFTESAHPWSVTDRPSITIETLQLVIDRAVELEIMVIGCGPDFSPPPEDLREALRAHGIVLEWMDTGAACRTFNVLLTEERRIAAALVAV